MKKRVLSMLMALALCLTLLPASAWAEGADGGAASRETITVEGGQPTAAGAPTEGNGQSANTGEGEQSNSETDTQTEIWCVSKPDSIGRSYDGTTDGGTIPIDLTFTDGTNEIKLKEGTGFTAKKTFDSADAGWHTVTVEIALIGDAAAKYKLKAGEETFTIGGNINKAYPDLTVSLSKTACTAGEKLLPLLSVEGAPEDAEVTYYYAPINSGYLEFEGSEAVPKIDENTAISEPGTYYVYAKTGEAKNYKEERSATVELTVNEAVVEAASVTKADGTDGGTYESLPAALNAAQDGDTVKLLADHVTDADALNALGENFTFEQYASIVPVVTKTLTLDLNHKTVDYLEVGFSETNEETQEKETLATGNLTVTGEAAYGRISNLMFMAGALDIRSGEIGGSGCAGLFCDANSGSVTVSNGTVYGLTVFEGASVTVNGGSNHAGEWVVASGAALNITDGTFGEVQFTRNGTIAISGGTFKSIKSYIAEELQPLMSLLDTQKVHAFYKGDDVQDGNATELTDVTVKEHTHAMVNNKCACGLSCTHKNAEGASTIGKDGKCTACGTQFAAVIGETYYTDVPSALDAAADGQTVKLLANEALPSDTYVSKTLTLDLDGHSLDGYSLNVGGLTATSQVRTGKLTVVDSSGGNGAVGVTVRDGGKVEFRGSIATSCLRLQVYGGDVKFYGGNIRSFDLYNSVTYADFLPEGYCYYNYSGSGSDLGSIVTAADVANAVNVGRYLAVAPCSHGGANGFDGTNCPYCNAPAVAETALNNGEGNRPWRRFADLQTALDADRAGGAEFKLLADVTGDYTINGTQDTGLDLNGHSIKGTVTVKGTKGDFITTTLSNTKNTTTASIDKVVACDGAELAGSKYPAVIGELTLAEGATWKTILNDTALGYKVLNADGTHKWYARDDVNGSQLNNVIINRLPITSKNLAFKVNGTNVKGNKVERGTTVQLCASCNANDVTVTLSILKTGETTPITLSGNDVQYTTVGTGTTKFYVAEYAFNDVGSYTISFTATKDGYTVTSTPKKLTVTKLNLSNAEITFRGSNESTYEPYNATTTAPGFTVTYNGKTLKLGVDYTASGTASSAGVSTQTLTIKAVEGSDYTGSKTAEWRIVPHKAKVEVGDVIKVYDGTTDLPDGKISLVSAAGSAGYQAGLPLPLSEGNGFELTDAKYDSANASETEKNISFTVKLTDTNYTFEDGTTEKAFTLNGAELEDKSFKINKAAAPTMQPIELTVINGLAKTYLVNLPALPTLGDNCKYGSIKYEACNFNLIGEGGYANSTAMITSNDEFQLTVPAVESQTEGSVGTVGVKITTDNYQDMLLTVEVIAKNKIVPVLDGEITATPITFGQILRVSTITGTMKDDGNTVEGTFEWTNPSTKPDKAGDYQAEWTFTPAAGYEKYATVTGTVTIKVNKATPTFIAPTAQENLTYTGQKQALITAGMTDHGTMQYSLTENGTYSQDTPTGTDAGAYTVWYRVIGDANHNDTAPASVAVRIGKKPLAITGVTAASKTYDGTKNADITSVTFDNVTLNRGTDYTVTASFDDAGVGNDKHITATVTLTEQAAKNYALEQCSIPTTGSITKATAPDFTKETALVIINGHEKTYTVTLPALPTLETPKEYGALTYEIGEIKLNDGYYTSGAKVEDGELTLPIQKNDVETTGSVGTVTVVIKSANYEDITLTVNVSAKNRITPTGTPTLSKNAITYGDALNTIALSGKLHDNVNNVDVDGTFEWVDGTHIPVVGNGTYAAEWIFEPTDTEKYLTVSGRSNITVEKATQYGKVSMAGYTYGQAPSTPTLTDRTGDANAQVTYRYSTAGSGSVQTWDIQNPPALNAGTYRMYASIGDTDNYYGFEAVYCEFVVAKATPTYTAPTGLTAKYGQTLADVTLPDGWSWMDSSESVGGASTAAKTFQAKFTPKDTENYNTVENIELEVTVNKADGGNLKTVELEQKYTDASDHTYTPDWAGLPAGQDWTFSSEASIVLSKQDFAADGSLLTYAISGGKAGDKITIALKASCDNYKDFTITLNVTLTEKDNQKPLTITGAGSVVYGQTLTLTTTGGSGTGTVTYRIDTDASTGEATIDPETGVLTPVKVGSVSVIATKAGDNDYNDITSAPFVLMIKPATPTGEPNYTKITTSGKTLKDAALTTKGSTLNPSDGKLEWVDDKGEPLPDDTTVKANTTYKWRFTPDDDNYTTLTGEVELYHKSSSGGGWYDSYYTIKATAGTGGSISPSGNVSVREGRDQTFTITPDKGYAVSNVKIDGKSIGAVKSYTFENVRRTHTIEVIFMKANGNPQTGVFVDVATGSYYEDAVDWAVENGITKGTDDTHFSPDGICTRAQAVTFLWRTAGSPEPETRTMPFTDVPVGSYYYDAVLWAVENGITKGTSDTTFSPNMTCTRAQIVAFLWRSEKSPAAGTANPFADVKSDAYYADAVLWAVKENITKGTTSTTFSPDADCTRAQIVTFLWRCKK